MAVDAANKAVTVSATVSGGNGVAAPADVTLTIVDDEPTIASLARVGSDRINGGRDDGVHGDAGPGAGGG